MVADERGHPVELRTPETAALVEADGFEPEIGQVLVALHVDVRRLRPVAGLEEEPVGASPEHCRHAERCYPEATGQWAPQWRYWPRAGPRKPGRCRRLTP